MSPNFRGNILPWSPRVSYPRHIISGLHSPPNKGNLKIQQHNTYFLTIWLENYSFYILGKGLLHLALFLIFICSLLVLPSTDRRGGLVRLWRSHSHLLCHSRAGGNPVLSFKSVLSLYSRFRMCCTTPPCNLDPLSADDRSLSPPKKAGGET